MNYSQIIKNDVANGPGFRVSLFVSGCQIKCPGCFNNVAWEYDYGKKFTENVLIQIICELSKEHVNGLTILGGEPFDSHNIDTVYNIIKNVRDAVPSKSIWVYTGYLFEDLIQDKKCLNVISNIDTLVDGPFVKQLIDITPTFRGSSNQRIINVKRTLETNNIVILEELK